MNIHSILKFIRKSDNIVTTREVAGHFKVSWNTAERYLLELALEGKVKRLKKPRVNLWMVKGK